MKIPTAGPDADTGVIRRQIEAALDAVDQACASLDGAVDDRYPSLLRDLVRGLVDADQGLRAAERKLGEMDAAYAEARELVADLEGDR